jgi:hypothetical protein
VLYLTVFLSLLPDVLLPQQPVTQYSVEAEVTVTVSQPECLSVKPILGLVTGLLSESCDLVSVGRPLWREDGYAVYSAITQWSESCRIRNHTLLFHLRLPQLGGPASLIYIPQEQGEPVIPSGTRCTTVSNDWLMANSEPVRRRTEQRRNHCVYREKPGKTTNNLRQDCRCPNRALVG